MMRQWTVLALLAALLAGCQGIPLQQVREPSWVEGRPQLGVRLKVVPLEGLSAELVGRRSQILQVVRVYPESPAQRAGVLEGDKLLWFDGVPVHGMMDSVAVMESKNWGDTLILTIERVGELQTVRVELSEQASSEDSQSADGE